jgi:haloalkane dehalogenase
MSNAAFAAPDRDGPGGSMTGTYRTPDERFEGLPGFDLQPRYREAGNLRLAHVEDGEGAPVVFLHGEPTWSFLWRKVIPPVRDAGFRCVAPDLAGFGRSDKPTDQSWYSFDRHTELIASLLEGLDLRDVTLVMHDWGGPIGLRIAVEHPDRVARLVAMDTGIFTGHQPMSEAWLRFADFVARTDDLPIGFLVRRGCAHDPGDEVAAAYDAPFPEPAAKAGAKAFPPMIPQRPDAPGALAGSRTLAGLVGDRRPLLLLWGEEDRPLPVAAGEAFAEALGRPPPRRVSGAGHFLQEDAGSEVGAIIAEWLG